MLQFDEAIALLARHVRPLATQSVPIGEAQGRYLAEDLHAREDAPRADVSMMDGYAVRHGDLATASSFAVVGEARPGMPFANPIGVGEAVRIFTGARVPVGADCVVMQEYASTVDGRVQFADGHGPARHIRAAGSDFRKGDTLLEAGTRLSPQALVAAGAADMAKLVVGGVPRVAIIATGDELVAPGEAHKTADARPETASYGVAALARGMGASVTMRERGRDDLDSLSAFADRALAEADCVVLIGGASVGEHDLSRPLFAARDMKPVFARLAIRPGKPVWMGMIGSTPILGLPGNPTSAMVTARLFLSPLLAAFQGGSVDAELRFRPMPLAEPLDAEGDRETFVRASTTPHGLVPATNQHSGAQAPLGISDLLIRRAPHAPACAAGTLVQALPL